MHLESNYECFSARATILGFPARREAFIIWLKVHSVALYTTVIPFLFDGFLWPCTLKLYSSFWCLKAFFHEIPYLFSGRYIFWANVMDGWMDGWIDGWMDGWMIDRYIIRWIDDEKRFDHSVSAESDTMAWTFRVSWVGWEAGSTHQSIRLQLFYWNIIISSQVISSASQIAIVYSYKLARSCMFQNFAIQNSRKKSKITDKRRN